MTDNHTRYTTAALIPAAGSGTRLAMGPKAFIKLGGKTLLERSVHSFADVVDERIVAVSEDMYDEARALLPEDVKLIVGGSSRQESVYALLQASSADIVLIHDAARPFLAKRLIETLKTTVIERGAASLAMAVADSLVEADTGKTVSREGLRAVQTPQAFWRQDIVAAHEHAQCNFLTGTDDASLLRYSGGTVELVQGSTCLFKITTRADFELAQALVHTWDSATDRF